VVGGNACRLGEGLNQPARRERRVVSPFGDARRRVNAHDAVGADSEFAQPARHSARAAHRVEEARALLVLANRRAAAGRRPHRRPDRTDDQPVRGDFLRETLHRVVAAVNVKMRRVEVQVDAVKPLAADIRRRRQAQHRVEVNERLGTGDAFADDARPGGVVQFWEVVLRAHEMEFVRGR